MRQTGPTSTRGACLVHIGVGGSIRFVAMFGKRFGDLPLILNGVRGHYPLHMVQMSRCLGIFRKAVTANAAPIG